MGRLMTCKTLIQIGWSSDIAVYIYNAQAQFLWDEKRKEPLEMFRRGHAQSLNKALCLCSVTASETGIFPDIFSRGHFPSSNSASDIPLLCAGGTLVQHGLGFVECEAGRQTFRPEHISSRYSPRPIPRRTFPSLLQDVGKRPRKNCPARISDGIWPERNVSCVTRTSYFVPNVVA